MRQGVAPVSSRAVPRRGPRAVQRDPDKSSLNAVLLRCHAWNSGMAVSAAMLACHDAAKPSTESQTLSASCVAVQRGPPAARSTCSGTLHVPALHVLGLGPPRPGCRARWGVPCDSDEVHTVQPGAAGAGPAGGKKAGGGSHSSAVAAGVAAVVGALHAPPLVRSRQSRSICTSSRPGGSRLGGSRLVRHLRWAPA
jgi:hypothetical protein